ncbi:MAG TPA: hypothetical protein VKY15_05980, partial [Acidimicrobiales bacterium]|nr:hypothetical protein [Acidimicrobiales bacterium]
GLALSLSVAYTVGAVAAFVHLSRLLGGIHAGRVARSLGRALVLSAVMGAAVALVAAVVGSDRGAGLLLKVVVSVATGVSVFFLAAGLAGQLSVAGRVRRPKV